jgi:heme exporter protein C
MLEASKADPVGAFWSRFAAPARFFPLAGRLVLPLFVLSAVSATVGLYIGFIVAPTDWQQGEAYRIIYIHVPAAWMSMLIYLAMAFWGVLTLVLRTRLSAMMIHALAPTGAWMTFLALWTGAFWGRPTWGTYWVWDARITSELILLFLYFGVIGLRASIDDERKADKACALMSIVGAVNIPIIYFSVKWWNTLHQGASVSLTAAPKMAQTMLAAMLIMTLSAWLYSAAVSFVRVRSLIIEREASRVWEPSSVGAALGVGAGNNRSEA